MSEITPSFARSFNDHQIKLAPGLPALPERLLLAHGQGRVLFIAGAGVSMQHPACLPDFARLVEDVFADRDSVLGNHLKARRNGRGDDTLPRLESEQNAMLDRIEDKEYDVALGMLERRMDRLQAEESTVRRAVIRILRQSQTHAPIHSALVRLADRGGATTLATTNFDLLFERAGRALRTKLRRYVLQDIPRPSLRPDFSGVLHLHGALDPDPDRQPELVLTDRDFGEHYMRRRSLPDLVYDAARIFHIVLVGYSLSDPPMRYLLNAVAADGQRFSDLKERFAFIPVAAANTEAEKQEQAAELATWTARGITPIPYEDGNNHIALSNVLDAWAEFSPHSRTGSLRKKTRAEKELRRILKLERKAADETSVNLFAHLFRRGNNREQGELASLHADLRADPAWLDDMLEIVREHGLDAGAHASWLCRRAFQERLVDPKVLDWAARLGPNRAFERAAVCELVQWALGKTPEPWREAWELVSEAVRARKTVPEKDSDYSLGQRIRNGERSGALVSSMARLVTPYLDVRSRSGVPTFQGPPPKRPRRVGDLVSLSIESQTVEIGKELSLAGVIELPFLVELGLVLEAAVVQGLHFAYRIGGQAGQDLASLIGFHRLCLRGDEDESARFVTGIAPAVRLLLHTIGRIAKLDTAATKPFLKRWLTRADPVHARLWAAAAIEPSLADPEEVHRFLLARPPDQTWIVSSFPEIAELRAARFASLSADSQERLAHMLLKRPPATDLRWHGPVSERSRWRTGYAVRELTRIEAAGASLPDSVARWLDQRREEFQEFAVQHVQVFLQDFTAGLVAPTSDPGSRFAGLEGEALAAEIDDCSREPEGGRGGRRYVQDWLANGDHVSRLAKALLQTPSNRERYGKAWNQLGELHQPRPNNSSSSPELMCEAQMILQAIAKMSDLVLREAVEGLSFWLHRWSSVVRKDQSFLTAIAYMWPHAAAKSQHTRDLTDYKSEEGIEAKRVAFDWLNSPTGNLVDAFLAACPNLTETPHPFEADAGLRTIRDLVEGTVDRAGIIARFACMRQLPYFMRADIEWSERVLLSRLEGGAESGILWNAVARSPSTATVMARLGILMARRATDDGLEISTRKSLIERVCFAVLHDFHSRSSTNSLVQDTLQMLRSVPDELRAHAAYCLKRYVNELALQQVTRDDLFDHAIRPFLHDVWPKEQAAVTPAVAKSLASLPAASGRRFAEATKAVRRYLVPFDSWSMYDWGLIDIGKHGVPGGVIVDGGEAAAALDLLDLTIGTSPNTRVPHGLGTILAHLEMRHAKLSRDPRFARLSALSRM